MKAEDKQRIQALADLLITTLGDMDSSTADRTVKSVAEALYNDLLGIEGKVKKKDGIKYFRLCGGGETRVYAADTSHKFVPSKRRVG